ncbi:LamG domain-containing protein [Candidatus Bipolaricaulota bacterium]|nr:LamG domain-containing protein [Candidatus Bipolaricaulota bacterium]
MRRLPIVILILVLAFGSIASAAEEVIVPLEAVKSDCFYDIDMAKTEFELSELKRGCVMEDWLKDNRVIRPLDITGLASYWPMERGEGNTLKGRGENTKSGSLYGASWVRGKQGFAVYFDGEEAYGEVKAGFEDMADWTLTLWLTVNQIPVKRRQIYCQLGGSAPNTGKTGSIHLTLESIENDQKFVIWGGPGIGGNLSYPLPDDWEQGEWHHLTIKQVRSENRRYLYLDGKLVTTDSDPDINNLSELKFISPPSSPWFGALDELRLYDRALSDNEVEKIYQQTK